MGFFAQGKLKRIAVSGGPAQTLTDAIGGCGATWNQAGLILFVPSQYDSVYSVPATGGSPSRVTSVDRAKGDSGHRSPSFLPDGHHFIYGIVSDNPDGDGISVATIDSPVATQLVRAYPGAAYVRTAAGDYLLFMRQGALLAQPFDTGRLTLTGEPIPVTADRLSPARFETPFSVSDSGMIAYRSGSAIPRNQLAWVDRTGNPVGSVAGSAAYEHVEISPEGKRAAVDRLDEARRIDIWLIDLTTGTPTRFTFDPGQYDVARWSPDGSRLVFPRVGNRKGIYQKLSSGADAEQQVLSSIHNGLVVSDDWSSDGRFMVFFNAPPGQASALWLLPLFGDRKAAALPGTDQRGANGRFSPDNKWLAYESYESGSGRAEVFVRALPVSGARWQISREGGMKPRWRRDGKELYFVASDGGLMAAPIATGETFQAGSPARLFTMRFASRLTAQYPYDVSADGQRFLIISPADAETISVTVLLNWTGRPAK